MPFKYFENLKATKSNRAMGAEQNGECLSPASNGVKKNGDGSR
jgi:hypothetical protein